MFFFFDESFRQSLAYPKRPFGVLCGLAIPEHDLSRVSRDVFQLKQKFFGTTFAESAEIKGKELLKNYVFSLERKFGQSDNLDFARALVAYLSGKRLHVFGCVCFEKDQREFKCEDMRALQSTFRWVFERIDMYMKIKHKRQDGKDCVQ